MSDNEDPGFVEDLIRYDILTQEAMRGVVKKVLTEVASVGALPGEHHFYVTFDTGAAGVQLSKRMKEKYPDEMTIVVQHQFWDLKTTDMTFSIGLSFNEIPEMLVIPFAAITGFFDPYVQFGLQFDTGHDWSVEEDAPSESGDVAHLPGKSPSTEGSDGNEGKDEPSGDEGGSADVVSLDAFRKK